MWRFALPSILDKLIANSKLEASNGFVAFEFAHRYAVVQLNTGTFSQFKGQTNASGAAHWVWKIQILKKQYFENIFLLTCTKTVEIAHIVEEMCAEIIAQTLEDTVEGQGGPQM